MEKGCCGLKVLNLNSHLLWWKIFVVFDLSPLLSSGACDKLEELWLELLHLEDRANQALQEWLERTKAPRLRVFEAYLTSTEVIDTMSSPGVASGLQRLGPARIHPPSVRKVTSGIERGAWLDLRWLSFLPEGDTNGLLPGLMQAIGVGAPELRTLRLIRWKARPEEAAVIAQSLGDGACCRLEELVVAMERGGGIDLVDLARALEEGAPCSITLRKLELSGCTVNDEGCVRLARAMSRGALPNLEVLDLDGDHSSSNSIGVSC